MLACHVFLCTGAGPLEESAAARRTQPGPEDPRGSPAQEAAEVIPVIMGRWEHIWHLGTRGRTHHLTLSFYGRP